MNLFAVIPAFNADRTIARVIHGCVSIIPRENIIVIDDGSTDKTRSLVEQSGATILVHDNNRGKGAALRSGFGAALKYGCDAVITLDADLQHDPAYIPKFLELSENNDLDQNRTKDIRQSKRVQIDKTRRIGKSNDK